MRKAPYLAIAAALVGTTACEQTPTNPRITFPIWMYVSVTGVVVFLFLNVYTA